MAEQKIYECGENQNSKDERTKEKIRALKEVAVGTLVMAAGGILYSAGFKLGSSSADGNFGGAVSMAGGAVAMGGATVASRGVVRFVENSPKMQRALIHAYKNAEQVNNKMHSYTKAKVTPFVKKAIENVKANTKSVSNKVKMESIPFEAYKYDENVEKKLIHQNTAAKISSFISKRRER